MPNVTDFIIGFSILKKFLTISDQFLAQIRRSQISNLDSLPIYGQNQGDKLKQFDEKATKYS